MCASYRQLTAPAQAEEGKEGISIFIYFLSLSLLSLLQVFLLICSQWGFCSYQTRNWEEEEEEEGVSPSATEAGRHMALLWSHFKWKTQGKRTPSRQTLSSAVWAVLRDAWEDSVKWNQNKLCDLVFIHVWKHCFAHWGKQYVHVCVSVCVQKQATFDYRSLSSMGGNVHV